MKIKKIPKFQYGGSPYYGNPYIPNSFNISGESSYGMTYGNTTPTNLQQVEAPTFNKDATKKAITDTTIKVGTQLGGLFKKTSKDSLTPKGKGGFKGLMNNPNAGAAIGATGAVADLAGNLLTKNLTQNKAGQIASQVSGMVGNTLMSINPVVGAIYKGTELLFKGLGAATAKKSDRVYMNQDVMASSSYGGVKSEVNKAKSMEGNYSIYRRKTLHKANAQARKAGALQSKAANVINEGKNIAARQAYSANMLTQRAQNTMMGRDNFATLGRNGMKFAKDLLKKKLTPTDKVIEAMKDSEGVNMDKNIIVTGSLHARKHNSDVEHITNKGIPVVLEDGGKIKQTAEIEKGELILNLKNTSKLEELFEEYKKAETQEEKDKISIEAGKFICKQLLKNTIDKGNVITSIE